jgi:hypothetical protein
MHQLFVAMKDQYVDNRYRVGDKDHLKVFASADEARA